MTFYKGSHNLPVQSAQGDFLTLSPEQLAVPSVRPVTTVSLKDGIFDGRLGFATIDGVAATLVSAVPYQVSYADCRRPPSDLCV